MMPISASANLRSFRPSNKTRRPGLRSSFDKLFPVSVAAVCKHLSIKAAGSQFGFASVHGSTSPSGTGALIRYATTCILVFGKAQYPFVFECFVRH
jgi:hypothetical protein